MHKVTLIRFHWLCATERVKFKLAVKHSTALQPGI